MNSEKVKEIKKALECCIKLNNTKYSDRERQLACINCPYANKDECDVIISKNCLTLINELESENERLLNQKWDKEDDLDNYHEENKKLKNRVAELEEYIKGNEQDAKAFVNGWHKDLETELKQFAEKLKEKLYNHRIWELPYEEWCKGNVVCRKIDETLKEFIGE